jgi:hypothetical protein
MTTKTINPGTQEGAILELLQSRGTNWTPAPELARISLQYCRAISTLRKAGFEIDNRTEQHGRKKHGFYQLTGWKNPALSPIRAPQASTDPWRETEKLAREKAAPLFGKKGGQT